MRIKFTLLLLFFIILVTNSCKPKTDINAQHEYVTAITEEEDYKQENGRAISHNVTNRLSELFNVYEMLSTTPKHKKSDINNNGQVRIYFDKYLKKIAKEFNIDVEQCAAMINKAGEDEYGSRVKIFVDRNINKYYILVFV